MENIGFDGRERLKEFPTGRWVLGFAVGDFAWWLAWAVVLTKLGYDDLFGATFFGATFLYTSLYTPGVRLLAAIIDWTPFVLTAAISYGLKFGDRSGWPILVWIGAAYVLSGVTCVLLTMILPLA